MTATVATTTTPDRTEAESDPKAAERTIVRRDGDRLVWRKRSAAEPAFWDRHWAASQPPRRVRNLTLPRWYSGVFDRVLPRDGLIVEAGCGAGVVVQALADRGYDIEGLDFATDTVSRCREVHPEGRYRLGDVRELPYDDGSVAGLISLGVVEHFDDSTRDRILRETVRCLRPGGVAVVTTPYFSPLRKARAAVGGYDSRPSTADEPPFYQYAFTRRDLASQLAAAGLHIDLVDAYGVRKGVKDTLGKGPLFRLVFGGSEQDRPRADHPPRAIRLAAAHMLLIVGRKP